MNRVTHWTYGSGSAGCLYDNQGTANTRESAIACALEIFEGVDVADDVEDAAVCAALRDAQASLATNGIYYFPSELRGTFGADYVEVSEHDGPNPEDDDAVWEHFEQTALEAYETHPDKGLSFGPRKVEVTVGRNASYPTHFVVFAFGSHSAHYVAVGYEKNRYHGLDTYDALEDAAATLPKGYFHELDLEDARNELIAEGAADDMISDEAVFERAKVDLTYTESGYLASWEWTIVRDDMTRDDLLAFIRNEE